MKNDKFKLQLEMHFKNNLKKIYGDLSYLVGPEKFFKSRFKNIIWNFDIDQKMVSLTFDDGPNDIMTPQILEILEEFNVKATFFVIGKNLEKSKRIAIKTLQSGHEIGNHTYSHRFLPFLTTNAIFDEVSLTHKLIQDELQVTPRVFRFPFGLFDFRVLKIIKQFDYLPIIGDVYPRDSNFASSKNIMSRVNRSIKPGSIVILHDGGSLDYQNSSHILNALRIVIPMLKDQGYKFTTVSGLIAKSK